MPPVKAYDPNEEGKEFQFDADEPAMAKFIEFKEKVIGRAVQRKEKA